VEYIPLAFQSKKLKTKHEKYQNAPMTFLIIQNTHVKNTRIPPKTRFLFCFFKVKNALLLDMKSEKT
jgi:hypothetical protein